MQVIISVYKPQETMKLISRTILLLLSCTETKIFQGKNNNNKKNP